MEKQKHPSRYYKSFYERAPIGFYTTDVMTGEFIMLNSACAKMLGFNTPKELLDQKTKSTEFYDAKTRKTLIRDVRKSGGVCDYELQIFVPNTQKTLWVSVSATFCEDNECLQGSITDISKRKQLEQEIEEMKQTSIIMLSKIKEQAKGRLAKIDQEYSKSRSS